MSLSKDANSVPPTGTGRVILGTQSQGLSEMSVSEFQGQRGVGWTEEEFEEYKRRVRDRAEAAAREVISSAVEEAKGVREQAMREGYRDGLAQCQAQAAAAVEQNAEVLSQAMRAVQGVSPLLWSDYRQDVAALVALVVNKVLGVELSRNRQEILASVMDQALDAIDSKRGITVRVNPQDQELAAGLLERAKSKHPDLERWGIRPDDTLEPGGVIVESRHGMVDNSLESRLALVEPILEQLAATEVGGEVEDALHRSAERVAAEPVAPQGFSPMMPPSGMMEQPLAAPQSEQYAQPEAASMPEVRQMEPEVVEPVEQQAEEASVQQDITGSVMEEAAPEASAEEIVAEEVGEETAPDEALEAEAQDASEADAALEEMLAQAVDAPETVPEPEAVAEPADADIEEMLAAATDAPQDAEPEVTEFEEPSEEQDAVAAADAVDEMLAQAIDAPQDAGPEPETEVPEATGQDAADAALEEMLAQATDAAPAEPASADVAEMLAAATDAPQEEPEEEPSDDAEAALREMLAQATDGPVAEGFDFGESEEAEPAAEPSQDAIDEMMAAATDAAAAPAEPSQDDIDAMLAQASDATPDDKEDE